MPQGYQFNEGDARRMLSQVGLDDSQIEEAILKFNEQHPEKAMGAVDSPESVREFLQSELGKETDWRRKVVLAARIISNSL